MNLIPSIFFCLVSLCLVRGVAQGLPATLLLSNQTVAEGHLMPRQAGTTVVQFRPKGESSLRSLNLKEIKTIFFDVSAFQPGVLQQAFLAGNYPQVIEGLKGRVNPYFSFTDCEANSNELVMMFIHALYRTGNNPGVEAARKEVEKYADSGEVRRLAEILHAIGMLQLGDTETFDRNINWFRLEEMKDPLAPMIHIGLARRAVQDDNWEKAYPYYAKVITQNPLATPWVEDALYQTALYQQLISNLGVAHQIAQELKIITANDEWKKKASSLQKEIEQGAETAGISLLEFGGLRGTPRDLGAAKIDYRKRQQELEESIDSP